MDDCGECLNVEWGEEDFGSGFVECKMWNVECRISLVVVVVWYRIPIPRDVDVDGVGMVKY